VRHKVSIGAPQDFEKLLDEIGGLKNFVKPDDRVFIKPNICAPKSYETGTTTNPYLIERLILLLKNITQNIRIGDGPIPAFGRLSPESSPLIYEIAKKYKIDIIDLNNTERQKVKTFFIAKPILEADVIINMPVLKSHVRTGITASLKNMMGAVPFRLKHEMHKSGLENRIVELTKTIRPHLNIVDATICQEGDGPTNGTPKELGLVILGDNQVAVDGLCCRIMGISPRSIPHIKLAGKEKIGSISNVDYIGFKSEFVSKFKMPFMYKNRFIRFSMEILEGPIIKFFERNNGILIDKERCGKCNLCVESCPVSALKMTDAGPIVDNKKCILCLCCHEACLNNAIKIKKMGISGSGIIPKDHV